MKLLIRVRDKDIHPDWVKSRRGRIRSHMISRAGDVIVAVPDSHEFSEKEKANPDWIILSVPGLTDKEATELLMQEPGDRVTNQFLNRKDKYVDLSLLDLTDTVEVPVEIFRTMVVKRSRSIDPDFIGVRNGD